MQICNYKANGELITSAGSGGSGITELTGDVTAGPGSGSVAATLVSGTDAVLTTPLIDAVKATNGTAALSITGVASAVNRLGITNAAAGSEPELASVGSDADIDLLLVAKGAGVVKADGVEVVTLSGTQTLTNKTLTTPRIGTSILDANGNEIISLTATGSAVNQIGVTNAAAAGTPQISAVGDDTDISIDYNAKGTGRHIFEQNIDLNDKSLLKALYTDLKAAAAPANPAAGYIRVYADSGNSNHVTQRDSAGAVIDLAAGGGSGAMTQLVAWTVLGADTASVSMSSISGSYKHLLLKIRVRTDHSAADDVFVRFNADTTAGNYYTAWGFGTSGSEGGNSNYGSVATITPVGGVVSANTATAGYYTTYEIMIIDYVSTSYFKTYNAFSTYAQSASSIFSLHIGGQWLNSADAITAISIAPRNGSNLKAGSAYGLWGVV